ncbi:MAG: hypothetical protein J2P17_16555 [Mycobacterium sp.]|nr:hypothetical protein [Mycobacterium sp.]
MNVGELRAALTEWPDDTPVAVIDGTHRRSDLDTDALISSAINHPVSYHDGRSWHWQDDDTTDVDGELVLVIY